SAPESSSAVHSLCINIISKNTSMDNAVCYCMQGYPPFSQMRTCPNTALIHSPNEQWIRKLHFSFMRAGFYLSPSQKGWTQGQKVSRQQEPEPGQAAAASWAKTEVSCGGNKREKLSQDGILGDGKDARLMEHVCWEFLCAPTEGALTA
ncbi:hypothetical protein Nmel_003547, partial [Mimus melanotis]